MTYSEKLRSPLWQKKRLQILERDGWACKSCGTTTKNLQVHHIVYARRDPWDYPDDSYQTLCSSCHEERQTMADGICNEIKMWLSRYPAKNFKGAVERLRQRAIPGDQFRNYLLDSLNESFDLSEKEGQKIKHGLFSDAVSGLFEAQILRDKNETDPRNAKLLRACADQLMEVSE
jgi:hypothetical protein